MMNVCYMIGKIMKKSGGEIFENVGYIIDDGEKRLYATSDTVTWSTHCHL